MLRLLLRRDQYRLHHWSLHLYKGHTHTHCFVYIYLIMLLLSFALYVCRFDSCVSMQSSSFGGFRFVRRLKTWKRQFWRFEDRFGLVTSGIPLFAMCYFMMYVGVVVLDKQAEHRYLRVQSLTNRELSLKEEYDAMHALLAAADDQEPTSVPLPRD